MVRKFIFIILIFLILFTIILNINSISSAFTSVVVYDDTAFNADFGDIELLNYTICFWSFLGGNKNEWSCYVVTYEEEPYLFYNNTVKDYSLYSNSENGSGIIYQVSFLFEGVSVHSFDRNDNLVVLSTLNDFCTYCNFNLKNESGEILFVNTSYNLELFVSNDEPTTEVPIVISTNYFNIDTFTDILVQYSYDEETWVNCNWGRLNDSNSEYNGMYNFYLNVYSNDTYYFRLVNLKTMDYQYETVVIDNIIYTQDNPRQLC